MFRLIFILLIDFFFVKVNLVELIILWILLVIMGFDIFWSVVKIFLVDFFNFFVNEVVNFFLNYLFILWWFFILFCLFKK